MEVAYAPVFLRALKALPPALRQETIEKVELFRQSDKHKILRVHKLKGRLSDRYSFSVNYRYRIVFQYAKIDGKRGAYLLDVGDHAVYR